MNLRPLAALAALALSPPALAQDYLESVSGDLSDDRANPTPITLHPGITVVEATQQGNVFGRDIDYLTVTVLPGFELRALIVDAYTSNPNDAAFLGVEAGPEVTVDPVSPTAGPLLGGIIYGAMHVGNDILPAMGNLPGAMGFTPPLAAGEYSFWFNQTGAPSTVRLHFDTSALGLGASYCAPATPNSTGQPGRAEGLGSASIAAMNLSVRAFDLPQNAFGYVLVSRSAGLVQNPAGSSGDLCLTGDIGRFVGQIQSTGTQGEFTTLVNVAAIPQPTGPVAAGAGETWLFQAWHRDAVGGSVTSNFTDGWAVTFQP